MVVGSFYREGIDLCDPRLNRIALKGAVGLLCMLLLAAPLSWSREPSHGFSYFGDLKYPEDVPHLGYANPDARKGGRVHMSGIGTFTNLNVYADKGNQIVWVDPRWGLGSFIHDPLLRKSEDELATYYCLLAENVEVHDDYAWVKFKLREDAHWQDGTPITMEDVVWTFDTIRRDGSIRWRQLYRDIDRLEQIDDWSFKFHFKDTAEKTPQVIMQTVTFTPQPKHYWESRQIGETTMAPPMGNGPYFIESVMPGYKVVFKRDENYWAKDLNLNIGHFNFDYIELTYYFDKKVMLQAMRAGEIDWWFEENEKDFATAYDFQGYHDGRFVKETYKMGFAYGMHWGVILNTRKPPLDDIRVREALTLAYNFEWANRVFWHEGMNRNNSFFIRSGLRSSGPPSAEELAMLEPFRGQIPERVFTEPVELPKSSGFGRNRDTLQKADALLKEAGWIIKGFERVSVETGERMSFDFVISSRDHERMLVPFAENLKRLGIDAVLRRVEGTLMTNRLRTYDYDATIRKVYTWKLPNAVAMRSQFTSQYADLPNMRNYPGIKNPAVDYLIEKIARADSEATMNKLGRVLDRVLLHSYYVIPDGHPVGRHVTHWNRIMHPPLGAGHMNWHGFPTLWWWNGDEETTVEEHKRPTSSSD